MLFIPGRTMISILGLVQLLVYIVLNQSITLNPVNNLQSFSQLTGTNSQPLLNQQANRQNVSFSSNVEFGLKSTDIRRTIDGSKNNRFDPNFGKALAEIPRISFIAFTDGVQKMVDRGNPREISNILGAIGPGEPIVPNQFNLNMLFVSYGQFIDHDLDLVLSTLDTTPVRVPKGDPVFDKSGTGTKKIDVPRSKFKNIDGKKGFVNQVTSFLDGSQIYGSNDTTSKRVRQFKNGKLKLINNMLQKQLNGTFFAGDTRANQNTPLTCLHIIFFREHNRQCDLILSKNPTLDDETVFQTARNKVIGFLQKIAFKDYLPALLGKDALDRFVGPYRGYKDTVNPTINLQFESAAFRFGHTTLNENMALFDYNNRNIKNLTFKDLFESSRTLKTDEDVDFTLNGLMRVISKKRNRQMVDSLRNLFNLFPDIVQDLYTSNIQRGRDQGIPDYNSIRRHLGLGEQRLIEGITRDKTTVDKLNQAYKSNVNNIDLWVGIITEQALPGSNLGQVGCAIVGKTFKDVRDGDRFWYESAYVKEDINEIEKTTLRDIILRNTNLRNIPNDVFKTEEFSSPSSSIIQANQFFENKNSQNPLDTPSSSPSQSFLLPSPTFSSSLSPSLSSSSLPSPSSTPLHSSSSASSFTGELQKLLGLVNQGG